MASDLDAPGTKVKMTIAERSIHAREPVAWAEARLDGIDGDCLAQTCLFAAFAELVTTYGEDAAATFAEGLATRIRNGEFSLELRRQ